MATTVHFTQKNGQPGQSTFPTRALAERYARTVKGASLVDSGTQVASVAIKMCPEGTAERQREATRLHYRTDEQVARDQARADRAMDAEHAHEREAEFWGASQAAGQSRDSAWTDLDFERRRGNL